MLRTFTVLVGCLLIGSCSVVVNIEGDLVTDSTLSQPVPAPPKVEVVLPKPNAATTPPVAPPPTTVVTICPGVAPITLGTRPVLSAKLMQGATDKHLDELLSKHLKELNTAYDKLVDQVTIHNQAVAACIRRLK